MRLIADDQRAILGDRMGALPTYRERMHGVPWLTGELVAGDGREKLDAWLASGPDSWSPMEARQTWLELAAFGDPDVACRLVGEVLARVPRPVSDYAIANCTFLAVGRETHGWCAGVPSLEGRPWLILISGHRDDDDTRGTIAHEVAHAWTLPPREGLRPAAWQAALAARRTARPEVVAAFEARHYEVVDVHSSEVADYPRREDLADRLARSWGF